MGNTRHETKNPEADWLTKTICWELIKAILWNVGAESWPVIYKDELYVGAREFKLLEDEVKNYSESIVYWPIGPIGKF